MLMTSAVKEACACGTRPAASSSSTMPKDHRSADREYLMTSGATFTCKQFKGAPY